MGVQWGHGKIGGGIDEELDINLLPEQAVTPSISDGKRMGVYGRSLKNVGVYGESQEDIGIFGKGGRLAAKFEGAVEVIGPVYGTDALFQGDIKVTGDVVLTNADCAEDFDMVADEIIEPGTVMVLGDEGTLLPSAKAYDKRVAGVISGAGNYKPGIILDKRPSSNNRKPIALLGKVYCKVDADFAPIEVGDLLTTSPTAGHAMKAADPLKAFGAVIGKALHPLPRGRGLVPILIALQ